MHDLLQNVNENKTGIFKRIPELVVVVPEIIAFVIGDDSIYLSEFVIAKIKGKVKGFIGHPKITDEVFYKIPNSLSNP